MKSGKSLIHKAISVLKGPALIASVVAGALLLSARHQGLLEPLELGAFDQSLRMRPALAPDPRLLVVTITEADIQEYKQWPISDALLQQLLSKLAQFKPRVIGLDIYRDVPVDPGHKLFAQQMQTSDNVIPVCKVNDGDNPGTPPPPSIPTSRVGFSDLLVDPSDGIVRRGLLFLKPPANSPCTTQFAFAFQLARRYLEKEDIKPKRTPQDYVQLGKAVFKPLTATAGGYQHLDAGGFQILLNYRSPNHVAAEITLAQALKGQLQPDWIKDRIVLIGVTAPSGKDVFNTPYSAGRRRYQKMPGVLVHAQLTSQILSAALDGQQMFWFWPEWGEALWIWGWSLAGGILAWQLRRRTERLLLAGGVGMGVLLGTSWILFTQAGWVPLVPAALALVFSGGGVMAYSAYQTRKEQEKIVQQAKEQQELIAQLNALLKRTKSETILPPRSPSQDDETEDVTAALTGDEETQEETALASNQEVEGKKQDGESGIGERGDKGWSSALQGRYEIIIPLGAGGFGFTYLAKDIQRPGNPRCVVKKLKPARRDEKFLNLARRLFKTEAEILEKLGHHSQIPQLLAYFEENQEFYLVQELIEGHPLSDELPVDRRLPEAQVVEIMRGVLEILAFIHERGVIHRDIKPSNIIRRQQDGRLVLIDFGAVKEIQPQEANEQESLTIVIGTRGYTPPEQLHGRPRLTSDIYALGMIGVQALTGIHPNQLPQDAIAGDICWRHLAGVGEEFGQILEKMVCYHFVERYQSAGEVLQDLKRLGI